MLKSLNAWTVDASTGFAEMFRQVRAAGFDGIELNVDAPGHSAHSLTMRTSDAELQKIRAACEDTGLKIVSISSSLYAGKMGSPLAEEREFAKALVRKQLECAAALGADGILCVPGGQCPRIPYAQDWAQSLGNAFIPPAGNSALRPVRGSGKCVERLLYFAVRHGALHR